MPKMISKTRFFRFLAGSRHAFDQSFRQKSLKSELFKWYTMVFQLIPNRTIPDP